MASARALVQTRVDNNQLLLWIPSVLSRVGTAGEFRFASIYLNAIAAAKVTATEQVTERVTEQVGQLVRMTAMIPRLST